MSNYIYSPSQNMIIPVALKQYYVDAGTWPDDPVEISDETAEEFSQQFPQGKTLSHDENNQPCWIELPPPTHEEQVEAAEHQRQQLLQEADEETADWRVELMLGDISEEDKEKLSAWMDYKKQVKAVDTSTAPDITWPTPPEV